MQKTVFSCIVSSLRQKVTHYFLKKKNHPHAFYHPKKQNWLNMNLKPQRQQYISNPKLNCTTQQKLEDKQMQITVFIILHWNFKNQECSQNIKYSQLIWNFHSPLHWVHLKFYCTLPCSLNIKVPSYIDFRHHLQCQILIIRTFRTCTMHVEFAY